MSCFGVCVCMFIPTREKKRNVCKTWTFILSSENFPGISIFWNAKTTYDIQQLHSLFYKRGLFSNSFPRFRWEECSMPCAKSSLFWCSWDMELHGCDFFFSLFVHVVAVQFCPYIFSILLVYFAAPSTFITSCTYFFCAHRMTLAKFKRRRDIVQVYFPHKYPPF